ncbi:MAG: 50S ribosomal protein L13 [Candidatus Zixiibacteriota bacterium]
MKTIPAKKEELNPKWYIVDAKDEILGRLASKIAMVIRGKHKANYTPHLPTGDCVIVLNSDKVRLTGNKEFQKHYERYSGYRGGLKILNYKQMMNRDPGFVIRHAVKGMLPKNRLGRVLNKRLHVYAGTDHPHQAQNPEPLDI